MRYRISLLFTLIGLVFFTACDRKVDYSKQEKGQNIIAFYNVENLFDTIDDPMIDDAEFLPNSKVAWTSERYKQKLKNVARALSTIGENKLPVMIGLCEVENKQVVIDLLRENPLNQAAYSFIHKDSPDERGIDVSLLFNPKFFKATFAEFIPLPFPFDTTEKTRDILYVKGLVGTDSLHIFLNHWTSRWGGQQETEEFRVHTAGIIATYVDSLENAVKHPNIIIMGDLNDNPDNISLAETLDAQMVVKDPAKDELYNLSWDAFTKGEGSIYWKSWDMFDQFIVSGNMMHQDNGLYITPYSQYIHKPDFLLFEDSKGLKRPNRTKGRSSYYGGYSDHLPVYVYLDVN